MLFRSQRPVPVPGDEDALVRVRACGVCGTDLKIIHDGMPDMPPYGEFIFGHEYAGDIVAVGRTVDEFKVGDRVVVEAHMGCRRCENCIRGLYTACLNYGNIKRGHRANGFTTNGGLAEYALNHVNTLYRIPADVAHAVRRNITIYTERGEGGTSVGRALALLAAGRLTAKPLITHQFPLARVHEAMDVLEKRIGDPVKVILNT